MGINMIEYVLDGPFQPGEWTYRRTFKKVTADYIGLDDHLGYVKDCTVHAIVYEDGSHWFGGAPL